MTDNEKNWLPGRVQTGLFIIGAVVWAAVFAAQSGSLELVLEYGHFFFLGLLGALIANATGSGGGVIFIPFFTGLGLSTAESLGTSILIQCFGMTAGSLSWLVAMGRPRRGGKHQLKLLKQLLVVGGLTTIAGILVGQYGVHEPPWSMVALFRTFSIIFGVALLVYTLGRRKHGHTREVLVKRDQYLVGIVGFLGGIMTAWISIGVGEWVALLLIFRRYPTMVAVSTGVCLSSIAVLTAANYHIWIDPGVVWEIILFAAPAAIIGSQLARPLAYRLGPARLKIFFATWILVTGLLM